MVGLVKLAKENDDGPMRLGEQDAVSFGQFFRELRGPIPWLDQKAIRIERYGKIGHKPRFSLDDRLKP